MGFALLALIPAWLFNRFILGILHRFDGIRLLTADELVWSVVFVGVVGTLYMLIVESLTNSLLHSSLGNAAEIKENDDEHAEMYRIFSETRSQFRVPNARLYIADTEEINAYAIQSPTKKAVVFTRPLLAALNSFWEPERSQEQMDRHYGAIEGIIAHELSHLKHNDYVPSWFFLGTIRLADLIRLLLVRLIQGLIFVLVIIPFVGPLIGIALGVATRGVNFVTLNVFSVFVPRLIRFFDALPMRIVEQRCDNHAATVVGAGSVFLGLYSLAHFGDASRLRVLDDHPPAIVRVARVHSRLNRPAGSHRRILQSLTALNSTVAMVAFALFMVVSGAVSFVAADHLGWTNSQLEHPFAQRVAATSRDLSENAGALFVNLRTSTRPVLTSTKEALRPASLMLNKSGDRLAELSHGEATPISRESQMIHRAFVALVAVVLLLTVGAKVLDFSLAIAFLPYRLILKARENTQEKTDLDLLLYGAIDGNSLIGVLSLLKHGANKNDPAEENAPPLQYAIKKRRFRLAMHLAL